METSDEVKSTTHYNQLQVNVIMQKYLYLPNLNRLLQIIIRYVYWLYLFYFQIDVISLYLLFLVETISSGLDIISSLDEVKIIILRNKFFIYVLLFYLDGYNSKCIFILSLFIRWILYKIWYTMLKGHIESQILECGREDLLQITERLNWMPGEIFKDIILPLSYPLICKCICHKKC